MRVNLLRDVLFDCCSVLARAESREAYVVYSPPGERRGMCVHVQAPYFSSPLMALTVFLLRRSSLLRCTVRAISCLFMIPGTPSRTTTVNSSLPSQKVSWSYILLSATSKYHHSLSSRVGNPKSYVMLVIFFTRWFCSRASLRPLVMLISDCLSLLDGTILSTVKMRQVHELCKKYDGKNGLG